RALEGERVGVVEERGLPVVVTGDRSRRVRGPKGVAEFRERRRKVAPKLCRSLVARRVEGSGELLELEDLEVARVRAVVGRGRIDPCGSSTGGLGLASELFDLRKRVFVGLLLGGKEDRR